MLDGFGSGVIVEIRDEAGVDNTIAQFGAVRAGADNTGDAIIWASNAGSLEEKLRVGGDDGMISVEGVPFTDLSDANGYRRIYDGSGRTALLMGGTMDQGSYYDNNFHIFRDAATSELARIRSDGRLTIQGDPIDAQDVVTLNYLESGYQPLDADLTAIAGLSPSNDDIIQRKAGVWTNRTVAQFKSDLGLGSAITGTGGANSIAIFTGAQTIGVAPFMSITGSAGTSQLNFNVDNGVITNNGGSLSIQSNSFISISGSNDDVNLGHDTQISGSGTPVLYFGRRDADGSWRIMISGDDLLVQQRESGNWVTKHTFSGS
jgi:hypothetical protein